MGDMSNMRSGESGRFSGEQTGARIDRGRVGIWIGVDAL